MTCPEPTRKMYGVPFSNELVSKKKQTDAKVIFCMSHTHITENARKIISPEKNFETMVHFFLTKS